jgi:uncharacterized membrane protein
MTEGKSLIPTILKSMLVWVIPMAIGFGFYDQTGKLTTNFWVFKITMVLTLLTITYLCFRKFYKTHSNWIQTSGIIIAINVILDIIVLVGLFKMPFGDWLFQVAPLYLICVPAVNYLLAKKYIK